MYRIGLTGGIASGKSTVVTMLKELGAFVIDCDVLAREVVLPGSEGLKEVVAAFGPKAVQADGTMDRKYIGSIVFEHAERKAELEGILFPLIYKRIDEEICRAETAEKKSFVFLDMPLLFEIKYQTYVDEVWLVYVDGPTQLKRLMARNGFSQREALARIRSQMPAEEKRSLAQVIIDNNGQLEQTAEQVQQQWDLLMEKIQEM